MMLPVKRVRWWLGVTKLVVLTVSSGLLLPAIGWAQSDIVVRTVQIASTEPQFHQLFVGTTRAANRVTLRPQIAGRLTERYVELGQRVEADQALARLYNPGASAQAAAVQRQWQRAQVDLSQSARDLARIAKLRKAGAASQQEFELANSAHQGAEAVERAAKAEAQRAREQDQEQVIRAPFAGVVTATPVEPGEVVQSGQGLIQLADPSQVELEVVVSAKEAARLTVGEDLKVTIGTTDLSQYRLGRIIELTPFRERGSLPTLVLLLPYDDILPGETAYVHIPERTDSYWELPVNAVVKVGAKGSGVYRVVNEHEVELVAVQPRRLIANRVYVVGDLIAGDQVVTSGVQRLFDGAQVEVLP